MASDRAWTALQLRRAGALYKDIGKHLRVSESRARQLVMQALREEARSKGARQPTEDALETIKH